MRATIFIAVLLVAAVPCQGRVITVDDDGPADFNNIQEAIEDANNGDIVEVQAGTYTGSGNRDIDFLGKAITVRSVGGPANCIIDCNGNPNEPHRGFHFHSGEGLDSILYGFTVTNAYNNQCCGAIGFGIAGGAIYCYASSPTISNCIIRNNTIEIEDWCCNDCGLRADPGGGGIALYESGSRISNCIFEGNTAIRTIYPGGVGGAIAAINITSTPEIINCTFYNNHAGYYGGAIADAYGLGRSKVSNCTIWGNTATYNPQQLYNLDAVSYCDVEGGYSGSGNIDVDPCFVDAGSGDYHLREDSPCINGGDPNYTAGPNETDIDGHARVMGSRVDMGADEYPVDYPGICFWPGYLDFYADEGGPNPASQILSVRNCGDDTLSWEITDECDWLTAEPNSGSSIGDINEVTVSVDVSGVGHGVYQCNLVISDPCAWNSPRSIDVNLVVKGPVIGVSATDFFFASEGAGNPNDQVLSISNVGAGTLNWEITEACGWLTVAPDSGSSTGEADDVNLSVDITGLTSGRYNCQLTVTDPNASNSPQTIDVNLSVGGPIIEVSAAQVYFIGIEGGSNPNDQILGISNGGGESLNWTINYDCKWLIVEPNSGSSTGEVDDVNLSVDISGLAVGIYDCNLTVSDPNASNSPQTVMVSLVVGVAGRLYVPSEYPTIQAAIDDAEAGETVIVADGIYTGEGNRDIDFLGKAITVRSENGPTNCIIDCNGSPNEPHRAFIFDSQEGPKSVVEGFTIISCYSTGYDYGGAILAEVSTPKIINCIFYGNVAENKGGAIGLWEWCDCEVGTEIINCTFHNNYAGSGAGAVHIVGGGYVYTTVRSCIFQGNTPADLYSETSKCGTPYIYAYNSILQSDSYDFTVVLENCVAADPCFADPCNGDFHLQSQAGRWDPKSVSWVTDANTSIAIDAGDPNSDWTEELWPHGKRINVGAYGGTAEASMSLSGVGNIANLDNDASDVVDGVDLGMFVDKWLYEEILLAEDLDRDNDVDFDDFDILGGYWGQ